MFAGGRKKKNFSKNINQTNVKCLLHLVGNKVYDIFMWMMSSILLFNAPVGSQDVDGT